MLFNSELFLFYFLPVLMILYYIPGNRFRNFLLMAAGLIFYGYGERKFIFILTVSMLINYLLGIMIEKMSAKKQKKIWLTAGIIFNTGILFGFKYLNFSFKILNDLFDDRFPVTDIALPLGISFYTFQVISYLVDIYRKDCPAEKNVVNAFLFFSFFPQLIAGPILRYKNLAKEIRLRHESAELFCEGVKRFIIGLGKKTILANNLAIIAEDSFSAVVVSDISVLGAWLGMICYTLQIYYDFSGYSDMAIGLGKMFGFHFDENFRYPYMAANITEFWRRWHITLSSWFRDYIYIPLGGSQKGLGKSVRNLFVVWLLTGIWHGADYTFIIWGLGYFVLLVLEKYIIKPQQRATVFQECYRIVTLFFVMILWVIFNSGTLADACNYIRTLIGWNRNALLVGKDIFYMKEYGVILLWSLFCAVPILPYLSKCMKKNRGTAMVLEVIKPVVFLFVFLYSVSFCVMGAHNPFIYFNF